MASTMTDTRTRTRTRLIDAAEALIAERGVDGVSVRAITAAAGANVAAVHYHFGAKEALVDAVLAQRMGALTERRLLLLGALADDPHPSPRAVVEAVILPTAEFAADPDGPGRTYVRFLAALDAAGEPWRSRVSVAFGPQYAHLDAAMRRALPEVAPEVLAFRLSLATAPILTTLADPESMTRHWTRSGLTVTTDDVVAALVDHVTGALQAPVGQRTTGGTP